MAAIRISFYEGNESYLYRLNARTKLLYILWVFLMTTVFSHPTYLAFVMATIIMAVYAGNLSLKSVLKAGRIGIIVGLVSWILWIIFLNDEGTVLFSIRSWAVTDLGVLRGLSVALRITTVLFAFLIVAMTTPTRDIITGLHDLHVPIVFSIAVGIILRLIPQLQSEHGTIVEAQRSRATEFDKGGLISRFRKHTSYIIPLSLRALKIVSDLSIAMESRAFDPYAPRTFVLHRPLSKADKIIMSFMLVTLVAGLFMRIFGLGGLGGGSFMGQ